MSVTALEDMLLSMKRGRTEGSPIVEDDSSNESDEEFENEPKRQKTDGSFSDLEAKHEAQWNDRYERLVQFKNETGHLYVPRKTEKQLNRWCITQRSYRRDGKLTPERIEKLDALGFVWGRSDSRQTQWDKQFEKIQQFIEKNGHSGIPVHKDKKLNKWVEKQRASRKAGIMSKERESKLDSIGFQWYGRDYSRDWQEWYDLLVSCKRTGKEIDADLSKWIALQSSMMKAGKLSVEKSRKLREIEEYDREKKWQNGIYQLQVFHSKHGHCKVPSSESSLFQFLEDQRTLRRERTLTPERYNILNQLGISWETEPKNVIDPLWIQNFQTLEQLTRDSSGMPMLPKDLYLWVRKQVSRKNNNDISQFEMDLLESLELWRQLSRAPSSPTPSQVPW
eukprot:TRINITY_DN12411_c0_g1_i1.p1 TRINITY_DN12411_c0_g1~~TRINITY_DN12411_c0_g1_i1.p1  ORF type:complete len:401 (+),score=73.28 TRINITY_DN12411_c0_g1_i1:27-1205(+)